MPDHEGGRRDAVDGAVGGDDKRGRGEDDGAGDVRPAGGGQHARGDRPHARRGRGALAKLWAGLPCGQVAEHAAHHRVCSTCGVLRPLKNRRLRRLQTLFGTVEVEAPRFKACRCRQPAPMAEAAVSPVCALLQAALGARTPFRDAARILDTLLSIFRTCTSRTVINKNFLILPNRPLVGTVAVRDVKGASRRCLEAVGTCDAIVSHCACAWRQLGKWGGYSETA